MTHRPANAESPPDLAPQVHGRLGRSTRASPLIMGGVTAPATTERALVRQRNGRDWYSWSRPSDKAQKSSDLVATSLAQIRVGRLGVRSVQPPLCSGSRGARAHSSPGVPAMLMELLRRATTHALHTFKRNKPKVQNREIGKQQQILCVYKRATTTNAPNER